MSPTSGIQDVRAFGAIGDGIKDDTGSVKQAIDSLSNGVLYFPPGVYLLREALCLGNQAIVVRGDGIGVTRLVWAADAASSGIVVVQSRQQHGNTDFTHVTGLSLHTRQLRKGTAITIDLTGQICPTAHCVVSRLNPRICVEQCEMRGESFSAASWECGLHLINGHHSVISNCHIIGHTEPGGCGMSSKCGIRMDGTGKPTEVQISQCWVFNTEYGILVTGHEGVKMSQCDLVMVGMGVHVDGCVHFNMANCHINACNCVRLRNTVQANINSSLLYKCGSSNGHGIQIEGNSFHNIVTGNTFVNIGAPTASMHAVVLAGNAHHCLVQGNIFSNRGDGCLCLPGAKSNTISNNIYDNPALNPFSSRDPSHRFCDVL